MRIAEGGLAGLGKGKVRSCYCSAKAGVSRASVVAVACPPEVPSSTQLLSSELA